MNTQTFAQAITDEELQAAGGGIFGGLITKGAKAAVKAAVKGAPVAIAAEGVSVGVEALANSFDQEA